MGTKQTVKKLDYKKEFPDLYLPKKKPVLIEVPKMTFFVVEGKGDPNTSAVYAEALAILYGLSFGIKMNLKFGKLPGEILKEMNLEEGSAVSEGNYVVPPLEGLWWTEDTGTAFDGKNLVDKSELCWFSMIRQPDQVTEEAFPYLDTAPLRLGTAACPLPFNLELENAATPQVADIIKAAKTVLYRE